MFASDVYGVVLGYYDNDYSAIKTVGGPLKPFELAYAGSDFDGASDGLYNGNIKNATVSLRRKIYYGDTDISMSPIGYAYTYDQLNRYVKMRAYNNYDTATNEWQSGGAALQDYAETVSYDGNGNIQSYIRHGNPTVGTPLGVSAAMDSLTYSYNSHNNQLNSVADSVPKTNYTTDIDNEVTDNYLYDRNGNMIFDSSQHLTITWNVRNKVASVLNDSTGLLVTFGYDAMGKRVMKTDSIITPGLTSYPTTTTWYIRDAKGNILSIYMLKHNIDLVDSLYWKECDIYGRSLIGVYYPDSLIYPRGYQVKADSIFIMQLWEGKRQYSLSNHLGSTLTTISDKKIMHARSGAVHNSGTRNSYSMVSGFQPEVVSISDMYPYGGIMAGRNFSLSDDSSFHYGFNGKFKDDDIEGKGRWLDFGERIDLTGLGIFGSTDPEQQKSVDKSSYVVENDNPLNNIDPSGGFSVPVHQEIMKEAMEAVGLNPYDESEGELIASQRDVDYYHSTNSYYHFDNRFTSKQVYSTWKTLDQEITNSSLSKTPASFTSVFPIWNLGRVLHTVMDFYSHSNYVELYVSYYMKTHNNQVPDVNSIPLYEDGVKIADFKKDYLDPGLHTGEFHVGTWLKSMFKSGLQTLEAHKNGHQSHEELNKDDDTTPEGKAKASANSPTYFQYAKNTALRNVTKILREKKAAKSN